ncbi:TetR/AcrR family transcriptional regulator [Thioalkalivibrio sp.]|uniref:TetR/AcrR family transcriptional regulator n=1 Tax=Thioalkalivibrio sp. TaxID=2093813 RepID=UPI003562CA29
MTRESDTRQRIVDGARHLIYGRSYHDVGVAEICTRAGVRKGSFYHFFPSKQELSLAVIDEMRIGIDAGVLSPALAPDVAPMQRLARFVERLYDFQRQAAPAPGHLPGCPFGNLALELATSDEVIRQRLQSVFADIESRFASVLEEAVAAGEIDNIDIAATARAMLAYIEGVLLMAKTANDPELIRQLGHAVTGIRIHQGED